MNYDNELMIQAFGIEAKLDEVEYLDLDLPEDDFNFNSQMHADTVPLKVMEASFAHFDWMAKLKSSEDPMIQSLLNQLAYLCICNGYRQGTIPDMERFGPNAKLAEVTPVTLMAAIFGSDLIMAELAFHLKCGQHEIVFPQSVYEMRKFLLENFVTRTYPKQGENTDYDWFHHAEAKRSELTWDIQAKSEIRTILSVVIKTKELVLDVGMLAEIIQAISKRNTQSQNFIQLNELNRNVRDEFRIIGCLNHLENRLNCKVFGQNDAVNAVTSLIGSTFGKAQKGPLGIATFVGQPDAGKTMLAETFCDEVNQVFRLGFQLTVINMEQFSDDKSASKLLGSGSQYVNSSLGDITAPIFAYPRQIIILDEIEKAHPTAIQSLLTILGKGEMRDATNRRLSRYNQCIFILTSNLGQKVLSSANLSNVAPDLGSVLTNGANGAGLSPELISRLKSGYVGQFKALSPKHLLKIAGIEFEKFKRENASFKVSWPECLPELVLLSLAGDAAPRAIRARFGALKTEVLRYAATKVPFEKAKLKITSQKTTEQLRVAIVLDKSRFNEIPSQSTGFELITNSDFDSIYENHKQQPFDAILTDEAGCRMIDERLGAFHGLPVHLLMGHDFVQPHHSKLCYQRAIPHNLQKPENYPIIFDIIAKHKMICQLLPDLKRRRSRATYELQHNKYDSYDEITIGNFKYEQTFDPKDFDNHFVKMPIVAESTLDELLDGSELKRQLEELKSIIDGKLWKKFDIPKGFLFSGPPGGGKTHAAKALAGACKMYFFQVNAADLISGDVTANINHLFDVATSAAPAILFIDELDSIACDRLNAPPAMRIAVNALLTRLDGFIKDENPLIVIGATNLVEKLDPALLRAGRLERVIHVPLPNELQREKIIKDSLQKYQLNMDQGEIYLRVQASQGMTLKAIENCFRDFALSQVCHGKQTPTQSLVSTDVDTTLDSNPELDKLLRRIAIHEAGHAVCIKLTKSNVDVECMWITQTPELAGVTKTKNFNVGMLTRELLKTLVQHQLAGRAAEEVILGANQVSTGSSIDLRDSTEMVKNAFLRGGMSEKFGFADLSLLPAVQAVIESEVVEFLNECYLKTLDLLNEHKGLILKIANELYSNKTLSKDDINRLCSSEKTMTNVH